MYAFPSIASEESHLINHSVPSVTTIVYSTCSLHAIENEHVVRAALKSEEARTGQFMLAGREVVMPTWHRRGIPEELDEPGSSTLDTTHLLLSPFPLTCSGSTGYALSLVRCLPGEDATNGFFVSCFKKVQGSQGTKLAGGHATEKRKFADGKGSIDGRSRKRKRVKG